jgi:hypothetical protein
MALADDIRALRDRALAELKAAHDYYSDTKIAWGIIRESVRAGNIFASKTTPGMAIALEPPLGEGNSPVLQSEQTGTVTTEADLAGRARDYIKQQLPEATFQQFISIFEAFFVDFMRLWLLSHPENLSKRMVDFKTVLELPDKDAIAGFVVDKELNEIAYKSPTDWFRYVEDKLKLDLPTRNEIEKFAEAKASRDVLVHNRGIANKIYESKAGALARYKVEERIEIPGDYHKDTWQLIRKMVSDISDAAVLKAT